MFTIICDHLFSVLAADNTLYQGGNEFAAGFGATKREMTGDTPTKDCLNLFDAPYMRDSLNARPAIYRGDSAYELTDEEAFPVASLGRRVSHRILKIPLVLIAADQNKYHALAKRNQLVANMARVLSGHLVETGFWYDLDYPGNRGGGDLRIMTWLSGSGTGSTGIYEACARYPVRISYSTNWSLGQS